MRIEPTAGCLRQSGDDTAANDIVAHLIDEMGYAPVELGGTRDCALMEAPRRSGSVYGEE